MYSGTITAKDLPQAKEGSYAASNGSPLSNLDSGDMRIDKLERWKNLRAKLEKTTDRRGRGIDEEIFDTVMALNALGFNTHGSCGGHEDRPHAYVPWVDIGGERGKAYGEGDKDFADPTFFWYVGQLELFKEKLQEHGFTFENWSDRDWRAKADRQDWDKVLQALDDSKHGTFRNGFTEDYREYSEQNRVLMQKMVYLLSEFYNDHKHPEVSADVRLRIAGKWGCEFRILSVDDDVYHGWVVESESVRNDLLPRRRQEMARFTEFLQKKFFSQD